MQTHAAPKTAFKDMSSSQKTTFVLKLIVCIVTFGIVFPNVMND